MYHPKFTITNQILSSIGRIEAAKEVIENAPLVPAWERQFKKEAVVRAVHYSTHIEGNALNFLEVKRIIDGRGDEVVARDRDIQEIVNYRKAMEFIDRIKDENRGVTEGEILKIHEILVEKIVPREQQGHYRNLGEQAVLLNSLTLELRARFPKADAVPDLVRSLVDWTVSLPAGAVHPVLRSGILQYELAWIHPFVDGNGRVARTVSTLSLYRGDYDIKRFFCLDEYYDEDAAAYYNAIAAPKEKGDDLTPWLEYFSEGLAIELNRVKTKVLKLSKDAKLRKAVGQVALNERQEKIIEHIQDYGSFTNSEFDKLFPKISDDTRLRDVRGLISKGILKKEGQTKAARYVLR